MSFTWNPALETGNAAIDNQHKQLIGALNALFDAYRNGKERQEVERTMDFLTGYAIKHFADEEALQLKYCYPDYLVHRQLHSEFKGVVQELAQALSRNGPTDDFIRTVYITVGEWLVDHIKSEDFKMAVYVQRATKTT